MKNILWRRALFLFLLAAITGCMRESKRYFIFLHPSDTSSERLQAAVSVINKRLLTVYEEQVTAQVKDTLVELQLREKVNVKELLWLVMSEGRFSMQEVYPNHEILQRIITIDPGVSDIRFLDFQSGSSSGSIGEAGRYDTAEIMHSRTMQTIKKENKNLQLLWGTETKQWSIPLYPLKRPTSRPILDNHSIKTAKLDF
jgi:hypothetical protein